MLIRGVLATGRPERYRQAVGASVLGEPWFDRAMTTRDGGDFAVDDITTGHRLDGAPVAIYSTAIRAGGDRQGAVLGALGIFFDWGPQAQAIVDGLRLSDDERARTRALLLDADGRVIAASDRRGLLTDRQRSPRVRQQLAQARWRRAGLATDGAGEVAVVGEADVGGEPGEVVLAVLQAIEHGADAEATAVRGDGAAGLLAEDA